MKKSFALLTVLLLISITTIACNKKEEPPMKKATVKAETPLLDKTLLTNNTQPALTNPSNLFNSELLPLSAVYKYTWYNRGLPIGESVFSINKTPQGNYEMKTSGLENTMVLVDQKTLQPIKATRKFDMKGKEYTISSEFQEGKVNVKAELPTGTQNATVELTEPVYHNDALLLSLMAMELEPGAHIKFTHYNPSNSQTANYDITVLNEETVNVPAGEFQTYKLKLDYSDGLSVHYAWYQKDTPHKMIKYNNTDANTTAKFIE
jgi:hypothetical protein